MKFGSRDDNLKQLDKYATMFASCSFVAPQHSRQLFPPSRGTSLVVGLLGEVLEAIRQVVLRIPLHQGHFHEGINHVDMEFVSFQRSKSTSCFWIGISVE